MKINNIVKFKQMKKIVIIIILVMFLLFIIFIITFPYIILLSRSIDNKKSFENSKYYFYNVSFEGIVVKKGKLHNVEISLMSLDPIPIENSEYGIGMSRFFFFHMSEGILFLYLPQYVYENINVNDTVVKDRDDYYIKINGTQFQLLGTNKKEWFPDTKGKSY